MAADSLAGVLRDHADRQPDRVACGFLPDGESDLTALTYAQLDHEARRIADLLADRLAPGARAILVYDPGIEFVAAFFGCLYAGVAAVPVTPPSPPGLELGLASLQRIRADSGAEALLTTRSLHGLAATLPQLTELLGEVAWIATDRPTLGDAKAWRDPGIGSSTVALLQYTSGSTSDPKGVVVRNANLMANQEAIAWALQIPEDAVMVGWLPMYHDMGLIGTLLSPLYRGSSCYLISPLHFLQRPARWLELVGRFHAYISGGPNFAYDLCVRRVSEEERAGLDLSDWRVAFNGAEPIRADTVRRFQDTFGPCGFRPEALVGCYGLAEATLLAAGAWSSDPKFLTLDRADMEERARVTVRPLGSPGSLELVPAGNVPPGHEVLIVDAAGAPLGPGRIGEIWFRGPSVAAGYWNQPEETEAVFGSTPANRPQDRFLRTGDLGFVMHRRLYVSGRLKDLLIVRGRNVYPQDVETAAQAADARLRAGGGAAFPIDVDGEEFVCLVQETTASDAAELERIARVIRSKVYEDLGVALKEIYLVPPRSIPKTSSGKVRRHATREASLSGRLSVLHAALEAKSSLISVRD